VLRASVCTGVTRGGKVGHLPPGAAFWGRQIEVSMLSNNYEISMSMDAINYD